MRLYEKPGTDNLKAITPPLSDYVNHYVLAADTAEQVEWPDGAMFCNITGVSGEDYYVRAGGQKATVPSADVTDGTGSAMNPSQRSRAKADGILEESFWIISASITTVTIEFWGA